MLEIPQGPYVSFTIPSDHRIAVYKQSRPDVEKHFAKRRDF